MYSEDFDEANAQERSDDVYSKQVRAGKRTYFFDVKATRNDDYYITVTESRKKTEKDGRFSFEKHKIHLYKEDFCKFSEGFEEVVRFIREHKPECFRPDGSAISNYPSATDENETSDEQ